MPRLLRAVLLAALLAAPLVGCSALDTTQTKVETVDEAVALLHKIDQDGTWMTLDDALTALRDRRDGYQADLHWTAEDGAEAASRSDVLIRIQTDAAGSSLVQITEADMLMTYYSPAPADPAAPRSVYRVEDGVYTCLKESDPARQLLQEGLASVFETYAVQATGLQTLSVVEKDGDTTIAGRKATHYTLSSQVPAALDILSRFENAALRSRIEAAGTFELSGSLDLDHASGALLGFDMTYRPADLPGSMTITFAVTQWGGVPALPQPTAAEIAAACD